MLRGASADSSSLTVEFDDYKTNAPNGQGVMYKEITPLLTSLGTGWSTPYALYVNKGMLLEQIGTLVASGQNIAEYKVFINTPDAKYHPYVAASEQHLIDYTLG